MEIDIHLSAERISKANIERLEKIGFVRDIFTNNRRCDATAFHASYKEHLSKFDDKLWTKTIELLKADEEFIGCLEEEFFTDNSRFTFDGGPDYKYVPDFDPFELEEVKIGKHKACDIHISVDFNKSLEPAKAVLESLGLISFDRPLDFGFKRVYSLRFETEADGEKIFEILKNKLSKVNGLFGKMKIEKINRFFVLPETAVQLPIVRHEFAINWIKNQHEMIIA